MKTLRLFLAFLAIGCSTARGADEVPPAAPAVEMKECFDWFQKTGVPDLSKPKWVEVVSSYEVKKGKEPQKNSTFGFALSDDGKTLKLLTADLDVINFSKGPLEEAFYKATVDWNEADFGKYAESIREYYRKKGNDRDSFRQMERKLSSRQELFFLAFASSQRGDAKGAAEFFELAKGEAGARVRGKAPAKELSFREELERDFGHVAMWRAVIAFGGGEWGRSGVLISRKELLGRFQDIIRLYPASDHIERAKSTVATLEKMVAEDEAHSPITDEDLAKLPVEAQVKELVFRLRDQNGHQTSQPGWCDIFNDPLGDKSPAKRLLKIGYPAAPQLIEALSDTRFSRSVGFHRDFYFSHTVLTVGDCALAVLQQIAGTGFFEVRTTSSYMSKEDQANAVKKAAIEWWKDFQKKGEKQILIEKVSAGERNSPELAERLLAKYRDEALEPILRGAKQAKEEWSRKQLTTQAAKFDKPEVVKFIRSEMKSNAKLGVRVHGAWLLRKSEPAESLAAMLKEWRSDRMTNPKKEDADSFNARDGVEAVIRFLATANSPEAIAALGEGWAARSAAVRMEIIEAMFEGSRFDLEGMPAHRLTPGGDEKETRASSETIAAAEKLLMNALLDTTRREGMSGSRGDFSYRDPRLCDIALYALHQILPDKYTFTTDAAARLRNEERIRAINAWRRVNGGKELPMPSKERVKLPAEKANQITTVTVSGGGSLVPEELSATMSQIEGKVISADMLVALLAGYFREVPSGFEGVEIEVCREADLTGVDVAITMLPGKRPKAGESMEIEWDGEQAASFRGSTSADTTFSGAANATSYKKLHEGFEGIVQMKPELPFTVRAVVRPRS